AWLVGLKYINPLQCGGLSSEAVGLNSGNLGPTLKQQEAHLMDKPRIVSHARLERELDSNGPRASKKRSKAGRRSI
ncbi:hypothetical protein Ancab_005132, partial [Ancistrocladus abbreviatus]